jgi:hypothetical protein
MPEKEPLPTLPPGCVVTCATLAAAAAILLIGGFGLAGRVAAFGTWAILLAEALRTREIVALRPWGVGRASKPKLYWAVAALFLAGTVVTFYFVVEAGTRHRL